MDVHERAMSQASVLQQTMLAFNAMDRDNLKSIFNRQVEAVNYRGVMNVKKDDWVVAVQKAYEEEGDHLGRSLSSWTTRSSTFISATLGGW